eukprot:2994075-Amphidinium_carterae.1
MGTDRFLRLLLKKLAIKIGKRFVVATLCAQDDYEVLRKIGRGKYSEVFEGIYVPSGLCK